MKIKSKLSNEPAFTGDLVLIDIEGEKRCFMITEEYEQANTVENILFFVDLENGISHKYVCREDVQFKAGFHVRGLGVIEKVISGDTVEIYYG